MREKKCAGFTIIELLIVLSMIGIIAGIAIPNYMRSIKKSEEAVLKENLFILRDTISKFYKDKNRYPSSLQDLVTEKYLMSVPADPITDKKDWILVRYEPAPDEEYDPDKSEAIVDVKSNAKGKALDETEYSEW